MFTIVNNVTCTEFQFEGTIAEAKAEVAFMNAESFAGKYSLQD